MTTHTMKAENHHSPRRRLEGRRILITGAASGIGRRTAALFHHEGARVALLDRDGNALNDIAAGIDALVCEADVTDETTVDEVVTQAAHTLGGLDGLVNAAGVMLRGAITAIDAATWRRIIDINLTGPYIVARTCIPWLRASASPATIVNLGSGQALLPNAPERSAYAASKGGVLNLSRALAAELAPEIRVNCVCPGLVDTPMAEGVRQNTSNYALDRIASPLEIAQTILFLTSGESSFVTGAALAVDGGRSFH